MNKKITNNYAFELVLFNIVRQVSDGITFFNLNINWDRYIADHSPRFEFELVILNITLIDFNYYYIHHRDIEQEPSLQAITYLINSIRKDGVYFKNHHIQYLNQAIEDLGLHRTLEMLSMHIERRIFKSIYSEVFGKEKRMLGYYLEYDE